MSTSSLQAFLSEQRQPAHYAYLLIDPLAGYEAHASLALSRLAETVGPAAVTTVLRGDLAHTPPACPHLITLAEPGRFVDTALIDASLERAQQDARLSKRYVCGWLTSPSPAQPLASSLAAHCVVTPPERSPCFLPLFEPVRLELLAATSQDDLCGWLGNVSEWVLPNSSGSLSLLQNANPTPSKLSEATWHIQQDASDVSVLLSAWRYALTLPMSYAPRRWQGDTVLPPQAAAQAWRELRDARRQGLAKKEDLLVFGLHRLMLHPHLNEHPHVQSDIARAARGETSLADRFDTYNDLTWSRIVSALTTQR